MGRASGHGQEQDEEDGREKAACPAAALVAQVSMKDATSSGKMMKPSLLFLNTPEACPLVYPPASQETHLSILVTPPHGGHRRGVQDLSVCFSKGG